MSCWGVLFRPIVKGKLLVLGSVSFIFDLLEDSFLDVPGS